MINEICLGELFLEKGKNLDPSKFPNETFELFSIPAYDSGSPEIIKGSKIGSSKKLLMPNDIVLSRIVPHIRRCCIIPKMTNHRQIGSGEWIVFRSKLIYPDFLRYYLLSDEFNKKYMNTIKGVGGSLMRADPNEVAKFKIHLPSITNQKNISVLLNSADKVRQLDHALIEKYNSLTHYVFISMFGDPVTNPKKWKKNLVNDIAFIVRGSSPRPKGDPKYYGKGVPRLMVADLTRDGLYVTPKIDSLTLEGAKKSRPMEKGDLVMAVSGRPGLPAILNVDCCIHDGFAGFRNVSPKYNKVFLYYYFLYYISQVNQKSVGAIFKNITTDDIRKIEVLDIDIDLQNKFIEKVELIEKQKTAAQASLYKSEELFNSLLQKAFNGGLV